LIVIAPARGGVGEWRGRGGGAVSEGVFSLSRADIAREKREERIRTGRKNRAGHSENRYAVAGALRRVPNYRVSDVN